MGGNALEIWRSKNRVIGGNGTFLRMSFDITLNLRSVVMLHFPLKIDRREAGRQEGREVGYIGRLGKVR